ncbi:MAG: hypothetical protein WA399_19005, partial [Acidobacteriaceae bacterium]
PEGVVRAVLRAGAGRAGAALDSFPADYGGDSARGRALFPLAMYVAQNFQPITSDEEKHLIASAATATPIFPAA